MMRADGQQVLVLSPHPDDETFGCGGTIKLLSEAGAQVDVAYLTRGELGVDAPEATTESSRLRLAQTRSDEAREACGILGVREVSFLNGADGRLQEQPHLADEIGRTLAARPYSRVFCPWPLDAHPDHIATFAWLRAALAAHDTPADIWLYEVWSPLRPSIHVPIDSTIKAKAAAARAHKSQLACLDYLSAFEGLAAYRALACFGSKYAEAFLAVDRRLVLQGIPHA